MCLLLCSELGLTLNSKPGLQELEEDPELRSKIALYRNPDYIPQAEMTDTEDADLPDIPLEELLDDLTALQLEDAEMQDAG